MLGTDCNGAEWSRVGVRDALVIHRYIEKSRSAEGFTRRLGFFHMSAEGFLTFIQAKHRLECRRSGNLLGRMMDERVIHAITNRSFESLVQNSTPTHAVDFLQFGFEFRHVPSRPLLHNGDIEAAKLRHMKDGPRPLEHCRSRWSEQPIPQRDPQV